MNAIYEEILDELLIAVLHLCKFVNINTKKNIIRKHALKHLSRVEVIQQVLEKTEDILC